MKTTIYIICSLCTAKTSSHFYDSGDNREEAESALELEAKSRGFLPLPKAWGEERRRHEGWICPACFQDVLGLQLGVDGEAP